MPSPRGDDGGDTRRDDLGSTGPHSTTDGVWWRQHSQQTPPYADVVDGTAPGSLLPEGSPRHGAAQWRGSADSQQIQIALPSESSYCLEIPGGDDCGCTRKGHVMPRMCGGAATRPRPRETPHGRRLKRRRRSAARFLQSLDESLRARALPHIIPALNNGYENKYVFVTQHTEGTGEAAEGTSLACKRCLAAT